MFCDQKDCDLCSLISFPFFHSLPLPFITTSTTYSKFFNRTNLLHPYRQSALVCYLHFVFYTLHMSKHVPKIMSNYCSKLYWIKLLLKKTPNCKLQLLHPLWWKPLREPINSNCLGNYGSSRKRNFGCTSNRKGCRAKSPCPRRHERSECRERKNGAGERVNLEPNQIQIARRTK